MAHLTNGAIYYERRVKTGDWEHKFAHQTINYAFEDNDPEEVIDELLARARTLVVQHVHQALRGNKEEPAKARPDPVGSNGAPVMSVAVDPVPGPDPVVDPSVVVSDELNRGFIIPESFTKSDEELLPRTTLKEALETEILHRAIVAAETPATNLKAAKRAAKKRVTGTGAVEDPIVVVDPTVGPVVGTDPSAGPSPVILNDFTVEIVDSHQSGVEAVPEDFTATAPAPTDVDLSQALSRVNAKLKDRPRILALIGEFVQSGQSYVLIPPVRRTEFIARLEALA